ncbi:PP2C family protein-serine/threonine phosphatase [Streptomyces sp. NPDC058228]|uniref:PP2C family protein-serine/threonine phosphatase n=1 Tax=unclassified Streptomyces TaxID=2593676 RepID=UPI0036EADEE3
MHSYSEEVGVSATDAVRAATGEVDYAALFAAAPGPCVVLLPDLVIIDVNRAFCQVSGRARKDLVGQPFFDTLPPNPADPDADQVRNLAAASLERVLSTRKRDTMALLKYDISAGSQPGVFEERWWSVINTPVLGPEGQVRWILVRTEDVTAFAHQGRDRTDTGWTQQMEAELYERAGEVQRLNEELRQANARDRRVAIKLQEAMLHSPDLARHSDIAVRYLPAVHSLNVCGDWYDAVDLPEGRFSVAVGDVVGHGLEAATVMGRLRSALSAASRAVAGPAQALELLGLYARSVEGALATSVVSALIDTRSQLIIYSSAGHLPPVLLHPDGRCTLLDRATDPPLGARPQHVPRPQAGIEYCRGCTLVLYTDGLIERRDEDIDTGIHRLTDALVERCVGLDPEHVADTLLTHLDVRQGASDDIALVVVRL